MSALHISAAATETRQIGPPQRGRKVNRVKTLQRYMDRMRQLPAKCFDCLKDAYLSTYDIYSTIHELEDCSKFILLNVPAVHLMAYARSTLHIRVRGVTSERRRKDGTYICSERTGMHNVVYTGRYNYFSKTQTSVWAMIKKDKVYYDDGESSDEQTFIEDL